MAKISYTTLIFQASTFFSFRKLTGPFPDAFQLQQLLKSMIFKIRKQLKGGRKNVVEVQKYFAAKNYEAQHVGQFKSVSWEQF